MKGLKVGAMLAINVGAGAIVGNIIKHTMPTSGIGIFVKGCVGFTALVLGSILGDKCADYSNDFIDGVVSSVKTILDAANENQEESEVVEEA